MITLTTPPQINSVLGGNAPVGYDHLALAPITLDAVSLQSGVRATIRLTSTASPQMQPIMGTLQINASTGTLTIDVAQLDFYRQVQLTAPQITSVVNIIRNAQDALEAGLVTLGVIAGIQSTGV